MPDPKLEVKEWIDKIKAGLKDAVTLDVTTITGDAAGIISLDTSSPNAVSYKITQASVANATLIAHTHVEVDQDTVLYIKSPMTEDEKVLLDSHHDAVMAAVEARQAFVKMLVDIVS